MDGLPTWPRTIPSSGQTTLGSGGPQTLALCQLAHIRSPKRPAGGPTEAGASGRSYWGRPPFPVLPFRRSPIAFGSWRPSENPVPGTLGPRGTQKPGVTSQRFPATFSPKQGGPGTQPPGGMMTARRREKSPGGGESTNNGKG